MLPFLTHLARSRRSLQGRIVASVGATLLLILSLFVSVSLWALHQGTAEAFRARVVLAQALASRLDDAVAYVGHEMQGSRSTLIVRSGSPSTGQLLHLGGLHQRVGPAVSLFLLGADGNVLWAGCAEPCGIETVALPPAGVLAATPHPTPAISEYPKGQSVAIRLDLPVTDDTGRLAGVLVSLIDPRHPALLLFPDTDVERGLDTALIAVDGRLIAGSKWLAARTRGGEVRAAREHARIVAEAGGANPPDYRVHPSIPGRAVPDHVVAFAAIAAMPGWVVTVEQSIDEALALPIRVQWYLVGISGVTLGAAMALAFLDVRRITAPIRRLTEAARHLAAGNLEEPVRVDGQDEIGQLGSTFELMRVQIRELMDRQRNLAVLEERERIASEMHDGLGQVLGYVITKTMAVKRLLEDDDVAEAGAQVDQLGEAARGAYADIRESILALRTTLSRERGLLDALGEFVAGFERQTGIMIDLDAPAAPSCRWIDPRAEVQVLRIAQEALANVRKHAGAGRVSVRLADEGDCLVLDVADDGRGFDAASVGADGSPPHFGLKIMRERAASVGGHLTVEAATGAGARVHVTLPLRTRRGRS